MSDVPRPDKPEHHAKEAMSPKGNGRPCKAVDISSCHERLIGTEKSGIR